MEMRKDNYRCCNRLYRVDIQRKHHFLNSTKLQYIPLQLSQKCNLSVAMEMLMYSEIAFIWLINTVYMHADATISTKKHQNLFL